MIPIPPPTIHLNGTHPNTLEEGYGKFQHAINDALDAMKEIEFNARDYYPQGPNAFAAAVDGWRDARTALADIRDNIERIREHIADTRGTR